MTRQGPDQVTAVQQSDEPLDNHVVSHESPEPLIRALEEGDFEGLLSLYAHLHEDEVASSSNPLLFELWVQILRDSAQVYVGAFTGGGLSSVANVAFVPNLTRGGRPFAVVENVVTHPSRRRLGLARAVISRVVELAQVRGCYKVMLLSSASRTEAHSFYKSLGFDGDSKCAFVRRFKAQ